ncbi:MAG: flippase-like domain-containing protein [candidate division WOR-3 bacterium]|nr:flippase-like domain-containing protein [candidate division WOR-3 bacterium]MCX7837263.1 flippase-like domain-containing protein [candidate division WOR-3 bacterium]MDW8114508.1 lysylphosphatidylglycerol synthase transmembrane domain-containing protein [candidate division WOR-3 bacterium]
MKKILNSLRILIALILLYYLLKKMDFQESLKILKNLNFYYLFLAGFSFFLFLIISNIRWKMLCSVVEINFSFLYLLKVYFASLFFNNILPTAIGGDVIRIAYTAKEKGLSLAFSSVFVDRAIGFIGLFFFALLASFFIFLENRNLYYLSLNFLGTLILLLILFLLFSERFYLLFKRIYSKIKILKIGEKIEKLHLSIIIFKNHQLTLFYNFCFSLFIQFLLALVWYFSSKSLNTNPRLLPYFLYIPLIGIITMLPITVGGLGVRENSFYYFFKNDLGENNARLISLIFLLINFFFSIIGGIIFLFLKKEDKNGSTKN